MENQQEPGISRTVPLALLVLYIAVFVICAISPYDRLLAQRIKVEQERY